MAISDLIRLGLRPTSPLRGCYSRSPFSAHSRPPWLGSNITTRTDGGSIGLFVGYSPTFHPCGMTGQEGSYLLKSSYLCI